MVDQTPILDETAQAGILATRTPDGVVAWRNEDGARRIYPNNTEYAAVVPDDYFDGSELPTAQRESAVKELRGMLADTGLAPVQARALLSRSGHVRAEGKSAEEQRRETRKALSRAFDNPDAAMADAKRLITRDARFSKFIHARGLGNDSETILMLAHAARSQRAAGRLK